MIWIIGGTVETAQLLNRIEGKMSYIVTVATRSGKERLNRPGVEILRLNEKEMIEFIKSRYISKIVDISHPYACEVTRNAMNAAKKSGITYIRYVRKKSASHTKHYFQSLEECAEFIKEISGTVFFTTGTKYIPIFERVKNGSRFIYRVLPSVASLELCARNKIKMEDLVCVLGPVSRELNEAMFKEFGADYVVMKDSGTEGGISEKLEACKNLGITPLVIGRRDEEGISDMEKLVKLIVDDGV